MSTSKRIVLIVVRWLTVVVAVGFLVFYVRQARRKQMMLSSSKSMVGVYSIEPQATGNRLVAPAASGGQAIAPVPVIPPAPSQPSAASKGAEAVSDPFRFGILTGPERPVTLGGSKSMSQPVVEASDMLRLWDLTPKTTMHTFGLPFLRALPPEVTFGEPTIRVQAGIENGAEPPPTPATPPTPAVAPPVPAPAPAPTKP